MYRKIFFEILTSFVFKATMTGRLLSFLFPTPPASLTEVTYIQNENLERRRRGPIMVCSNQYGEISGWFTVRSVVMCLACLLVILLAFVFFPVHDVIREPWYWWECAIQCSVFWTALVGMFLISSTNTYLAISGVFGLPSFLLMWLAGLTAMAATWSLLHTLWVTALGLRYPMPLIGLINFVAGFGAEVAVLYFQIPRTWRQNPKFFTTIIWLVVTQLFLIVVFLLYFLLGFGFYVIPMDYQWTMALIIPFVDGFSTKILGALANKAAGRRDASVETIAGSLISISTSLFMSINLGSIATDVTSYVILGIAFFLNLIDILGVVRKIKGGEPTFEEACFDFQDLTINMVLEILLPIRYCQIVIKT